jgi:hypothetical protein
MVLERIVTPRGQPTFGNNSALQIYRARKNLLYLVLTNPTLESQQRGYRIRLPVLDNKTSADASSLLSI